MKPIMLFLLFHFLLSETCSNINRTGNPDFSYLNSHEKWQRETYITFSRIDKVWSMTKGSGSVIAILDWAFDLRGKEAEKYVFPVCLIEGEEKTRLKPWHGEWMAEIVYKIAPDAKIIPIQARSLNAHYQNYVADGIRYAADHNAVAVSSSLGPLVYTDDIADAIDYAESKGTLFIDVHPEIRISAEGEKIRCNCDPRIIHAGIVSLPDHPVIPDSLRQVYTWPYDTDAVYEDGWGNSNAPPIIAGVVALMKSVNSSITPGEIRDILISTTKMNNGFNVLDAESAVKAAKQQ